MCVCVFSQYLFIQTMEHERAKTVLSFKLNNYVVLQPHLKNYFWHLLARLRNRVGSCSRRDHIG